MIKGKLREQGREMDEDYKSVRTSGQKPGDEGG